MKPHRLSASDVRDQGLRLGILALFERRTLLGRGTLHHDHLLSSIPLNPTLPPSSLSEKGDARCLGREARPR
ncbi:hypothetical protein GQ602_000662 [Ophiocordyceps camponoti-floridani]|uniref:Uncharacterized protein n=1 Tax=Ophiocordyceps camponoti-floridani TaxID=2030778 RepID=A0A8H4VGG4_9HYPO|nr:hypothetical protein GQ602_000662 [Ophiocordyceps camponoti-floridani]